jgi:hypothetical protein
VYRNDYKQSHLEKWYPFVNIHGSSQIFMYMTYPNSSYSG